MKAQFSLLDRLVDLLGNKEHSERFRQFLEEFQEKPLINKQFALTDYNFPQSGIQISCLPGSSIWSISLYLGLPRDPFKYYEGMSLYSEELPQDIQRTDNLEDIKDKFGQDPLRFYISRAPCRLIDNKPPLGWEEIPEDTIAYTYEKDRFKYGFLFQQNELFEVQIFLKQKI